MNKRDLIDAISTRMGDKKTATEAVNAVLDTPAPTNTTS
jgi:DNA-binding protein HU-beta